MLEHHYGETWLEDYGLLGELFLYGPVMPEWMMLLGMAPRLGWTLPRIDHPLLDTPLAVRPSDIPVCEWSADPWLAEVRALGRAQGIASGPYEP